MIFDIFGSKKKTKDLAGLLTKLEVYQQMIAKVNKAQSLQKLNRLDEARQILRDTESMVRSYAGQNPREEKAFMMLAYFYIEADSFELAEPVIRKLLGSGNFQLSDEERLILSAELQRIRRQQPNEHRDNDVPSGYTQVYCCANCGRLHNFVSMPCPNCDWSPQTIEEMARSIILSNSYFKVPALLILAREMAGGRPVTDVVPNLVNDGKEYVSIPEQRKAVEAVYSLLRQDERKYHHSLSMVRECAGCGGRISSSKAEKCEKCGEPVNWPDAVRVLVCMDNLLWLFERRIEVSNTDAFSDFVCILVAMTNNLLRKQEDPSARDRQRSIKLLTEVGLICDLNKGMAIDTSDPTKFKVYFAADRMRADSETFGRILNNELCFFVDKMTTGIRP